ncbi:hypothetical protein HZB01_01660 [Candidatus Woesearchaeota archaeon]|nr:hypothetical protein [Candidatus Woesearchaeota archaeon]
MQNTIKEIKQAEEEAKQIVENAYQKKQDILGEGKHKSLELLRKNEETLKADRQKKLEDVRKELAKETEKMLADSKKPLKQLEQSAQKNKETVVAFILKKTEEELEHV